MEAKVILMRCDQTGGVFGTRVQKTPGGDWVRTWAFKINEDRAKREGYDKEVISGSMEAEAGFNGCPYCGTRGFYQCGSCKKTSCWRSGDSEVTCNWCGKTSKIRTATEDFTIDTDSF